MQYELKEEMTPQEINVQHAFSNQAPTFDTEDENNPILKWMRVITRNSVLSLIKKKASILELNCGTGIDSIYFAQQGFHITATDIAPGMLDKLSEKIKWESPNKENIHLRECIDIQQCSFNNLQQFQGRSFDHIFSNFGGLNCTDNLNAVIQNIKTLLNPGGTATLVLMPPVCLWELALALKGNFTTAFRRLKKGGTDSHLEGIQFKTYYYTPAYVRKAFGKAFEIKTIKGLGVFVPPPYLHTFARKHPQLIELLKKMECLFSSRWPFYSLGDHFLISATKGPSQK